MIVDSSVFVAILQEEPGYLRYLDTILVAEFSAIPAPSYLETCMVLAGRRNPELLPRFDEYLAESKVTILPFTPGHAKIAAQAFLQYGKGRHPAGLNFGDCIAYAVSKLEAMPLLYTGGDFALTDVETAILINRA